jgi:PAS domain S-box-containing protein
MSFRKKIIIFTVLVSSGLLVFLYSALLFVLNKNFVYLENDTVSRRLERVGSVSNSFFSALKSKALDWGEWDEAYNFVANQNPDFAQSNLNEVSLANLDLNALVFTDNDGQVLGHFAYNSFTKKPDADFINLFKGRLGDSYFRNHFMTTDFQQGIVLFPGNRPPLYLVSKQVLRSDQSGPAAGYVFMGRFLDEDFVNYLFGDLVLFSTAIERVDNPNLPADFLEARNKLIMNDNFVITPLNSKNIYGYSLFKDYSDNPAFVFRIKTDRTLYQYEINILLYISALLFSMILIFVLVFLWMINRLFVSRLSAIFNKVEQYKKNPEAGDIDITISGKDELSKLADGFNGLVKEISSSRNFYKNLLIRLPDIVLLIRAGQVIYINDAFETNTGFKKEAILGQGISDFIDQNYRDLVTQNMKLRFSGVDVAPYSAKILTKKEPLDVRVSAKVIDYQGDRVNLMVLTDISESAKAQQKIAEKVAELESLNRIMINRELKMMELKKQIEELKKTEK